MAEEPTTADIIAMLRQMKQEKEDDKKRQEEERKRQEEKEERLRQEREEEIKRQKEKEERLRQEKEDEIKRHEEKEERLRQEREEERQRQEKREDRLLQLQQQMNSQLKSLGEKMNHQTDQLKEEIQAKKAALVKEHLEHQRVEKKKISITEHQSARVRLDYQEAETQRTQFGDELETLKRTVDRTATDLEATRSQANQLRKECTDKTKRLEQARILRQQLMEKLKKATESTLIAEERTFMIEKLLSGEEATHEALLTELKLLRELRFRKSNELGEARTAERNLEAEIQGSHAAMRNLRSKVGKLDTDALKQQEKSQAYYVIKAAQEKEELQREGDDLDARIRKAEREIRALENILGLMNGRNEQYRKSFNKVTESSDEMEEKQQLEEQMRSVMDKFKYKRRQIRELQDDMQTMGSTYDNLTRDEDAYVDMIESKQARMAQLQKELGEQKGKIERDTKMNSKYSREMRAALKAKEEIPEERDFSVREMREFNKTQTTPAYHQSDGMVERYNRTLLVTLSSFVASRQRDWEECLPFVLMAFRAAQHEATGATQSRLMLGRDMRVPVDLVVPRPPDDIRRNVPEYVHHLQEVMAAVHSEARDRLQLSAERMKANYDRKTETAVFQTGDAVWLHNAPVKTGCTTKLARPWEGPYRVITRITDNVYRIQLTPKSKPKVVNRYRL